MGNTEIDAVGRYLKNGKWFSVGTPFLYYYYFLATSGEAQELLQALCLKITQGTLWDVGGQNRVSHS